MTNNNFGRDVIADKYNFRGDCIEMAQELGMIGGFGFSVLNVTCSILTGNDPAIAYFGNIIGGYGSGLVSYFFGNHLQNKNEANKEKALKNIERAFEGERK